jgi:hypothetical protein
MAIRNDRNEGTVTARSARERSELQQNARARNSEEDVQRRIRERAYELFERRGRANGFDRQDWFEAERQVRRETRNS